MTKKYHKNTYKKSYASKSHLSPGSHKSYYKCIQTERRKRFSNKFSKGLYHDIDIWEDVDDNDLYYTTGDGYYIKMKPRWRAKLNAVYYERGY